MSYTLIELERDIETIIDELADVRAQKGHDYSGTEDTFDNLRDYGWRGVEVRLGDKQKRLMHFVKSGGDLKVKDESIEDTMKDRINYALFSLILYRQEKKSCSSDILNEEGFASKAPVLSSPEEFGELMESIKQVRLPDGVRFDGRFYKDEEAPGVAFQSMRDWEEYWVSRGVQQPYGPPSLPGLAQTKKKPEIVKWVNDVADMGEV